METNDPYSIPESAKPKEIDEQTDTEVVSHFARAEVCILAVGWFYYCVGAFLLTIPIGSFMLLKSEIPWVLPAVSAVSVLLATLFIVIAKGLRCFAEWARMPAIVAAIVGLALFPLGTFAGVYCLILLLRNTSKQMFSRRYQNLMKLELRDFKQFGWLAFVLGAVFGVTFWVLVWLTQFYEIDFDKWSRLISL